MNRTKYSDLNIGYQTHPGETGKNNEDHFGVFSYAGAPNEKGGITLAIVADGIGGNAAGEIASEFAVQSFAEIFNQTNSKAYLDLFARAFSKTVEKINQHIVRHPAAEKMGSTCVAALIANRRLYTGYVGDSRIYLIRNGKLKQLTVDHTWVQEAIEHGILTRADAKQHPNAHVVRRHLGAKADPTPDYRLQLAAGETADESQRNQGTPVQAGDIIFLCSDGVHDMVEDADILAVFLKHPNNVQEAVDTLTLMARRNGGRDNITMIAMQVPEGKATMTPNTTNSPVVSSALLLFGIGTLMALALAAAAALGYYYYTTMMTPTPTAPPSPTQNLVITFTPPTETPTPLPRFTPTPVTPTPSPTWTPLPPTNTPTPTVPPTETKTP